MMVSRKIDLCSYFVFKFCIEVFIFFIMFVKMGIVRGNLEFLLYIEW